MLFDPLLPVEKYIDLRAGWEDRSTTRSVEAWSEPAMTVGTGVRIRRSRSVESVVNIGMALRTVTLKPPVMNRAPIEQQALMQGRMKAIDEAAGAVSQRVTEKGARERLMLDRHESTCHALRRNGEIGRRCVQIENGVKAQIEIRVGVDEIGATDW